MTRSADIQYMRLNFWLSNCLPALRGVEITMVFISLVISARSTSGADWPQFRGPDGQGHAQQGQVPIRWSETDGLRWKIPVAGQGWSSPVVGGDQIWLTTAVEDGRSLRAICVDRENGKVLHDVELFRPVDPGPTHPTNNHASPTPVLNGRRVYVHFGTSGTACLSTAGEIIWQNDTLKFRHPHAPGSSPIVSGRLLVLSCDGTDVQFMVALDKETGDVVWKRPRLHLEEARIKDKSEPSGRRGFPMMAYSTPLVINVNSKNQLVSTAADHVAAYDLLTGNEIWWHPYDGFSVVARPIQGRDCIFVVGFEQQSQPVMFAIRPDARGKITKDELVWTQRQSVSHVPSPILIGDEIYLIGDQGVAVCLDARTGKPYWKQRIGGNYSASPISVDKKIYFLSDQGKVTVIVADKEFHALATNRLQGRFMASPAAAGDSLFLRSATHLYRIDGTIETGLGEEFQSP